MIRPYRLTDLLGTQRQQHVTLLDLPESIIRGFSPAGFAARSALGPARLGAEGLLYTNRLRPIAGCLYDWPFRGEDVRLVALTGYGHDESEAFAAWERLVERTCLRAAGYGRQRVVARPEEGSECANLLHRLGFTIATRERILARTMNDEKQDTPAGFELLRSNDVWDAWKLYSRTEPVSVQRAEGLTPASWWRGRRLRRRPYQEWILRSDGNAVVHLELHYGRRDSALRFHYEPEHRGSLSDATAHAIAVAGRRKVDTLYCVVRDHQAELERLLLNQGFVMARSQVRLVLYTSVLSSVMDVTPLPVAERVPSGLRTGMTGLSQTSDGKSDRGTDWYNR